uniref:Uncharacterized protein n=1 Tax=Siphoviridae sp. ctX5W26 TaxID=2825540 RepID=A0A8S5UEM2_9CAUD|nr:MAG TPA: hypothetical protein [Siphoviridae sp. ctX5W26]
MKNKEKFIDKLAYFACEGNSRIALDAKGEIVVCYSIFCKDCQFYVEEGCREATRKWLEEEYVEPPTIRISKKDRAFLEYIKDGYKYIARDLNGCLCLYTTKSERNREVWFSNPGFVNLKRISVDFPMVKWEDKEPWLVEDLMNLKVVSEYE